MAFSVFPKRSIPLWCWPLLFFCFLILTPVLAIISSFFTPQPDIWQHLAETVLSDYVLNSLALVLGVSVLTLFLGVTSAWLIATCEFPGKVWLQWLLMLPMAMPAYILAYIYTGILDFSGFVQSHIRELMGWGYGDYYFPDIRSLGGAILVLSLALYPYIYVLARTAFARQSVSTWDVARGMGYKPFTVFFKVSLPLARPAIIAGLALVLMETLADYGTVHYFGISVLSTGIYRTWFGMGSDIAASQLAGALLFFVILLLVLESYARRGRRFTQTGLMRGQSLFKLSKRKQCIAVLFCCIPIVLGFLWPFLQLVSWVVTTQVSFDHDYWVLVGNTLFLASITAFIAMLIALFLVYMRRLVKHRLVAMAVAVAGLGYALPGTVIAVGVMRPFAALDQQVNQYWQHLGYDQIGLIFSGTLFILVFAYLVRFLAVAISSVQSSMDTLTPSMDDAAKSLGLKTHQILWRVHLPLLRGGLLSALLLVFVDTLKELPATLVLRPFNFNTLAVRSYELANDERLISAAPTIITIVLVGLLPVILINRSALKSSQ